jgi:hypothetical protein
VVAGDESQPVSGLLRRLNLPAAVQGPAGPPAEARVVAACLVGTELVLGIDPARIQPGDAVRVVFVIPPGLEELSSTGEVTTVGDGIAVVWLRSVPARTLSLLATYLASMPLDSAS